MLKCQIWDFICDLCHSVHFTSNTVGVFVLVTQFQHVYYLI